jgi:hypothetical protein
VDILMTGVTQESQDEQVSSFNTSQAVRAMEAYLREDARNRAADLSGAPTMTAIKFWPGEDVGAPLYYIASMRTQDDVARMNFEVWAEGAVTTVNFQLMGMLSLQFDMADLTERHKQTWLDHMRLAPKLGDGEVGEPIFLWSAARWESNYMIFVPQRRFVTALAFSPHRYQAIARILAPAFEQLLDWLEARWFPSMAFFD